VPKLIASGRRRPRKRAKKDSPLALRSLWRWINKNEFFLDIIRVMRHARRNFIGLFGRTMRRLTLTKWKNMWIKCPYSRGAAQKIADNYISRYLLSRYCVRDSLVPNTKASIPSTKVTWTWDGIAECGWERRVFLVSFVPAREWAISIEKLTRPLFMFLPQIFWSICII
jgi:hypothetical protein